MEATDHTIDQREVDVRKLCKAVLEVTPEFFDNPNGGYEHTCPFCGERIIVGGLYYHGMHDIKHENDCAWLIAKDLMTNIN